MGSVNESASMRLTMNLIGLSFVVVNGVGTTTK